MKKFIFISGLCIFSLANVYSSDITWMNTPDTTLAQAKSIIAVLHYKAFENSRLGNYSEAENIYRQVTRLKLKYMSYDSLGVARAYGNMGIMYSNTWKFTEALEYLNKAEDIFIMMGNDPFNISTLIIAKGNILLKQGDPVKAISFYEQAERIFKLQGKVNDTLFTNLNYNLSLAAIKEGMYNNALLYLAKAEEHAKGNKQSLRSIYLSYTFLYKKMRLYKEADSYFKKLIENYKISLSYKDYFRFADFLIYQNLDLEKGFGYIKTGLEYCNNNSNINTYLSRAYAYQILGGYYEKKNDLYQALAYYQKAIILASDNFTDTAISANPSDFTNIYDGRILYYLKSKAQILLKIYQKNNDSLSLKYALNSSLKAIEIINKLRYRYTSEASNFLISEQEKETFDFAEELAFLLYTRTGDPSYPRLGFTINEQGRGFSLLSSIRNQRATEYGGIPGKILAEENDLNRKLSLYEELIFNEKQLEKPDGMKISNWQSMLFNVGQDHERFVKRLEKEFPGYYSLKYDQHVTGIDEIHRKIDRNTAVIEYSILDSMLLIYYADKENSDLISVALEPGFENKCNEFFRLITKQNFSEGVMDTYKKYTRLGYELYRILIEPVKDKFHAKNLIIVPDGAISYIPFDALLSEEVNTAKLDYRHLPFLIREYSAGYSYSSTLHFNPIKHERIQSQAVLAFAPDYPKITGENANLNPVREIEGDRLLSLPGVKEEVNNISKIVKTDIYMDKDASEANFKKFADRYNILHLAMHTLINDDNPMLSRLAFTQTADTTDDSFLHTYEIYNMKFNASLAILSSCSSGYGKIQEGEGIQSLARGFAYAGCPSILMTLWEVADYSTVLMMDRFYTYLKDHDPKPVALRKAKLDFLADADQLKSNPFFWSSYLIIGDSSPIFPFHPGILLANIILLILPLGYIGIVRTKFRKEDKRRFNY